MNETQLIRLDILIDAENERSFSQREYCDFVFDILNCSTSKLLQINAIRKSISVKMYEVPYLNGVSYMENRLLKRIYTGTVFERE